jgi:hypothetical protein
LAQPAQRRLDPEVADILRTEAARERAQRAAEATGDLGARHAGASPAAPQGPGRATRDTAGPASHPGTLPDMDEIGSSLTPTRGSAARPHPAEPPQRSTGGRGFRAGFWVAMLAVGLAAILYLAAPDVVDLVPGAEAPVERYVAAVNDTRLRLDAFVDRMMARMSGG